MDRTFKSLVVDSVLDCMRGYRAALLAVVIASTGCSGSSKSGSLQMPTLSTPVFSPAGGAYSLSQMVAITDASPGATIHYTTDGSMPTEGSPVYNAPIPVASTETIAAFAAETGYATSAITTSAYTIASLPVLATPSIWVVGGPNSSAQTVTMTGANSAASIYYTTDGSTPTSSSTLYSGPIVVTASETIQAIAEESGYTASSVATTAVSISSTPWDTQTVPGQISYTEEVPLGDSSLSGAGFVNVVTQGGVDNTGATDAACTIQALLNNSTLTHNNVQYGTVNSFQDIVLYFPKGTYLISNPACLPLVKNYSDGTPAYGMVFLGESQSGVTFKLASNTVPSVAFTGNTVAGSRVISNVSSTAGLRINQSVGGAAMHTGATIASIGTNSITLTVDAASTATATSLYTLTPVIFTQSAEDGGNEYGNEGFHNVLENFTIDATATGNTGATGISYLASNLGAIRNVTLLGGTTSTSVGTGIDMTRSEIGPALIENVYINGFSRGLDVTRDPYSITVEHITFANQISGAIFNADNLVTANALWIKSGQGSAAITNSTGNGMIILANSRIDQIGSSLVANLAGGAVSIRNTTFASPQTNLGGSSSAVNGLLEGSSWNAGSNFLLPLTIDTPVVAYDSASQWAAPASGMSAQWTEEVTTDVDATTAINTALACKGNTSTLYLPHGIWYIDSPIQIPSWVDRIVGMDSTIRALSSASSKFPKGTPLFEVLSNSPGSCPYAHTLVIERLNFDGSGISSLNAIQVDAPANGMGARNVVIRDVNTTSLANLVNRTSGGGEVFLEDVVNDTALVSGTNYFFARQFNSEAGAYCSTSSCGSRITNNGAPVWVLGTKTEGASNIVYSPNATPPYAVSEIIGGFFYTSTGTTSTAPATTCTESGSPTSTPSSTSAMYIVGAGPEVEASFIEEVLPTGSQTVATESYPFYAYDAGNCIAGAGNSTDPYTTGVIQRTPIFTSQTEAGFIVPELLVKQ